MRDEREIGLVHVPVGYKIALRASVLGLALALFVAITFFGPWGLVLLALAPLILLFRRVGFDHTRVLLRIDKGLEVVEGDVVVRIPLEDVRLYERQRDTMDLIVSFPYHGKVWSGVIARKALPGSKETSAHDDPATYARIRGILS